MLNAPSSYPLNYPLDVSLQIIWTFTTQLNHNFCGIRFPCFFQNNLHDFSLIVFLNFFERVTSAGWLSLCDIEKKTTTNRFSNRSHSIEWPQRRTTTRSAHRSGNISHVCQSRITPPWDTSGSSSSNNWFPPDSQKCLSCLVFAYLVLIYSITLPFLVKIFK